MLFVKTLAESPCLSALPPVYYFTRDHHEQPAADPDDSIPTIDFSLLTSTEPHQRPRVIHDLTKACQNWGFFTVINHGVPASLMDAMIEACRGFFNLTEEEKKEFQGKHVMDPIRCGTSFNTSLENAFFWRDFLKVFVHPEFHIPSKPPELREIAMEYTKRVRYMVQELLKAISESLGLEPDYIHRTLNLESGTQMIGANFYPPCPQPELAMGLPPHSDLGLLTILTQNEEDGLQVRHKGKWVNIHPTPHCFVVNIGDQREILTNGRYKSVLHRAVVKNKTDRISIATVTGPPMDTVVCPSPELQVRDGRPPAFISMTYKDYWQLQQGNRLVGKSCLDRIKMV